MQTREIIYDRNGNVVHVAPGGRVNIKNKIQHGSRALKFSQPYIIDETDDKEDHFYISTSTPIIKIEDIKKDKQPLKETIISKPEPLVQRITTNKPTRDIPLSMFQNIQLRWRFR